MACTRLAPVSVSDELKLLKSVKNRKSMDPHAPKSLLLSRETQTHGGYPKTFFILAPHHLLTKVFRKVSGNRHKSNPKIMDSAPLYGPLPSWHFQAVQVPATDLVSTQEAVRSHSSNQLSGLLFR